MNAILIIAVIIIIGYLLFRMSRNSTKNSAVQNAFLAKHTLQGLSEIQKTEVKNMTYGILTRNGMLKKDLDIMCEIVKYSFFALAMNEMGIKPVLKAEEWHYVKNPYMALHDSDHQIQVVQSAFLRKHNVRIEMGKFKDINEMRAGK